MHTKTIEFDPAQSKAFEASLLRALHTFDYAIFLNPNNHDHGFDKRMAAGSELLEIDNTHFFEGLDTSLKEAKNTVYGFLSYDLKNQVESLSSHNPNHNPFPEAAFFLPEIEIHWRKDEVLVYGTKVEDFLIALDSPVKEQEMALDLSRLTADLDEPSYIEAFSKLQEHLRRGDIYEINLCMQYLLEEVTLDPIETYSQLNELSPTPFSALLKSREKYVLSASPERYLQKNGTTVISQPIKGTAPRGATSEEDELQKEALQASPKERSENLMVVDLVRNDLARVAQPGTVEVPELFGVYTFPQVHQLISTVKATLLPSTSIGSLLQATFPMGSMTGTPKIRAMELIEHYERSQRGVFSGAIGFITPTGDLDFNVVIRSMIYNASTKRLSFPVGSAITLDAEALSEYQECQLKASAILRCLEFHPTH